MSEFSSDKLTGKTGATYVTLPIGSFDPAVFEAVTIGGRTRIRVKTAGIAHSMLNLGGTPAPTPAPTIGPSYTLTVAKNPTPGGTVTGGGTYGQNTPVPVTATPAGGYAFANWTGDVAFLVGPNTQASNTMVQPGFNATITAQFVTAPTPAPTPPPTTAPTPGPTPPPTSVPAFQFLGDATHPAFYVTAWLFAGTSSSMPAELRNLYSAGCVITAKDGTFTLRVRVRPHDGSNFALAGGYNILINSVVYYTGSFMAGDPYAEFTIPNGALSNGNPIVLQLFVTGGATNHFVKYRTEFYKQIGTAQVIDGGIRAISSYYSGAARGQTLTSDNHNFGTIGTMDLLDWTNGGYGGARFSPSLNGVATNPQHSVQIVPSTLSLSNSIDTGNVDTQLNATNLTIIPPPPPSPCRNYRVFNNGTFVFYYDDCDGVNHRVDGIPPSIDVCSSNIDSFTGDYSFINDLGPC